MCLGVALVVQSLSAVVICAQRAGYDERIGRARMEEKEQGLAALRERALLKWGGLPWTSVGEERALVEGGLFEPTEGGEWVLESVARQDPSLSRLSISAWVERGRDGIDLPFAALVAGEVDAAARDGVPWLEGEPGIGVSGGEPSEEATVVGCLHSLPVDPMLGPGCVLRTLAQPWTLDPGWRLLDTVGLSSGVAPAPGLTILRGAAGRTLRMAAGSRGSSLDSPALVVVIGGADLDARGLGDFYGVLVVDEGGLWLEGTTVHGAVFVTDSAHMGSTGRIVFARSVLRWATDRSLTRVRLVPGTRREGT